MKQSQMFIPTLKEVPADAESASHQLLLRGGFIRQNAAGIYSYLPLGYKIIRKIEQIIREEMDRTGAQELLMPAMQPAELWHESGRWDVYGPELMRLKDRHGRFFAMGATGEEMVTSLVRDSLNTYKKLPMAVYQIQTKYRDEKRPRFGLLRGREFIMKDAYSFHADEQSLDEAYWKMFHAYKNVFDRCGLKYRAVLADSGAMGGKDTHEFQALADIGEDTIAYSDQSDYAANLEMAPVISNAVFVKEKEIGELDEKKGRPSFPPDQQLSVHGFKTRTGVVLVFLRAEDEVNDVKVKNAIGTDLLEPIENVPLPDPFHHDEKVRIIADQGVRVLAEPWFYNPANDTTYINVAPERDLQISEYDDVRFVKEGDPSPDGKGKIRFAKGIEVGQVFKLGTKYSEAMGALFLDDQGKSHPLIMGCYGIGVSRTLSAICEQYHDANGLIWPKMLAPFKVHLITVNPKKQEQRELSEKVYEELSRHGLDVLWDDRKERPGVKFADSELIGCPVQVVVGKDAGENLLEVGSRQRQSDGRKEIQTADLLTAVDQILEEAN
jgi:prolyl-tRNA synthetase, family II